MYPDVCYTCTFPVNSLLLCVVSLERIVIN